MAGEDVGELLDFFRIEFAAGAAADDAEGAAVDGADGDDVALDLDAVDSGGVVGGNDEGGEGLVTADVEELGDLGGAILKGGGADEAPAGGRKLAIVRLDAAAKLLADLIQRLQAPFQRDTSPQVVGELIMVEEGVIEVGGGLDGCLNDVGAGAESAEGGSVGEIEDAGAEGEAADAGGDGEALDGPVGIGGAGGGLGHGDGGIALVFGEELLDAGAEGGRGGIGREGAANGGLELGGFEVVLLSGHGLYGCTS